LRDLKAKRSNPALATELYTILLSGIVEGFHKPRLIIVADGALNFLPFEALQAQDGNFLASSAVVSYTPSATALWNLRAHRTASGSGPLLAIGDVDYADQHIPETPSTRARPAPFKIARDQRPLHQSIRSGSTGGDEENGGGDVFGCHEPAMSQSAAKVQQL
jgi:CHAT domain